MKNINIKSYKTWIIIFGVLNIVFLLWTLGLLSILKQFDDKEQEVITISPEHKFIKIAPPKDKQFPNEESSIWDVYKEEKKILKKNKEDEKVVKELESNSNNKLNPEENNFKETLETIINKDKKGNIDTLSSSKKTINNKSETIKAKLNKKKDEVKLSLKNDTVRPNKTSTIKNKIDLKNKAKVKSFYVQTASLSKKELVAKEWKRIQKKYELDIKNLIFITEKTKLKNNQVFYRLLVGKFKSNDEAKIFCKKININNSCIIKIIK